MRKAVKGTTLEHYVTGQAAVNRDFSDTSDHDLRRAEVITFTLVLILLLMTFRTVVSAFLPLLLGAAAVVSGDGAHLRDRQDARIRRSSPSTSRR